MKNILAIENGIATLLSNVDDGTNSIYINGDELASSNWVGTGNYTFTNGGVTFTIQRIADNTGNIMLQLVSGTTYKLVKYQSYDVKDAYFITDPTESNIVDGDYVPFYDTSAGTKKKSLWSNIIAKIKTALGIASSGSTFLRKDGQWATPTNTTYTFATGDSNGQIKVTPSGGTAQNVSVKGLGSAAYTASTAYAVSKTLTNENLNNVTTPGFYNAAGDNTCTNTGLASGAAFGLLVVHSAGGSYYYQIINQNGTSNFYRRICSNGTWGSWTQDNYTNTWRGIQNNLTSDSTTDSLSAAQGKALANGSARDSTKVAKSGDTITGSISYKVTSVDASKANNNVSSTQYPTTFNILDNANRILARLEGVIESDGDIGSYWYVRNYNTSGAQVASKGIRMTMAKDGTLTYTVSDTNKFRSAISGAVNKTLTNEDLNNVIEPGFYNAAGNNTCLHTPFDTGVAFGLQVTKTAGGDYYNQLINQNGTTTFYRRVCGVTGWSGWVLERYTWRGIQNNLTSDSTTDSLSAAQGKALANGSARDSTKVAKSGDTMTGKLIIHRSGYSDQALLDSNDGTTSATGISQIVLGNGTNTGSTGNSYGSIALFSRGTAHMTLQAQTVSSYRGLYLPASGTALATAASSSARVKKNIRDMTEEEALKILDVPVVKFDYKEEYEDGLLDQSGVIAEEVLEIIPEVVTIHPEYDETKAIDPASNPSPTVDYGKFAPYLIKMVQMQQERIDRLESIIEELRG